MADSNAPQSDEDKVTTERMQGHCDRIEETVDDISDGLISTLQSVQAVRRAFRTAVAGLGHPCETVWCEALLKKLTSDLGLVSEMAPRSKWGAKVTAWNGECKTAPKQLAMPTTGGA